MVKKNMEIWQRVLKKRIKYFKKRANDIVPNGKSVYDTIRNDKTQQELFWKYRAIVETLETLYDEIENEENKYFEELEERRTKNYFRMKNETMS